MHQSTDAGVSYIFSKQKWLFSVLSVKLAKSIKWTLLGKQGCKITLDHTHHYEKCCKKLHGIFTLTELYLNHDDELFSELNET